MRFTFLEIQNHVARYFGNEFSELTAADQASVKLAVNTILDDISMRGRIPILKKFTVKNVPAEYATGTITVATANGVSTVTGLLTAWAQEMEGRKLIIGTETQNYEIKTVSTGTSIILEEVYINADGTSVLASATAYSINTDELIMPHDFACVDTQDTYDLTNRTCLDFEEPQLFDKDYPNPHSTGKPLTLIPRGLTEKSFYSTGTVAVTKGSAAITITTGVFMASMSGMVFRVDGDSEEYIFTYAGATTGTLDRNYNGSTAATGTFKLNPPGLRILQIDPKPVLQCNIKISYYKFLPRLVNNNDICPLPSSNAVISGAKWLYAQYREKKDLALSDALKNNYEQDLYMLKTSFKINPSKGGFYPRQY